MSVVDYVGAMQRRLGLIEGMGTDATNRANQMASFRRASQQSSPAVGGGGYAPSRPPSTGGWNGKGSTREALYAFGDEIKNMGYRVSENSRYNNGKRVTGGHSKNSQHYSDDAIDINWAAGTSKAEQAKLRALDGLVNKYGLGSVFMAPGHYGHRHVNVPRRR